MKLVIYNRVTKSFVKSQKTNVTEVTKLIT
jgi:hypothetical protein